MLDSRAVLYDKIGPGPHPCRWCGRQLVWRKGQHTVAGTLITDHVDRDPLNNAPENLVPACNSCNNSRSRKIEEHELFVVDKDGSRHRAEERICEHCQVVFLMVPSRAARGRGRFCSLSCARRGPKI